MQYYRLYISGKTDKSVAMIEALSEALRVLYNGHHSLEIINLLKDPLSGSRDNVFITPTLVRGSPEAESKVFGDLSDIKRVMERLDSTPAD